MKRSGKPFSKTRLYLQHGVCDRVCSMFNSVKFKGSGVVEPGRMHVRACPYFGTVSRAFVRYSMPSERGTSRSERLVVLWDHFGLFERCGAQCVYGRSPCVMHATEHSFGIPCPPNANTSHFKSCSPVPEQAPSCIGTISDCLIDVVHNAFTDDPRV